MIADWNWKQPLYPLFSRFCLNYPKKATGLDKISARLLQDCADLIAIPLCAIFNQSLISGVFPDEWKPFKVIP